MNDSRLPLAACDDGISRRRLLQGVAGGALALPLAGALAAVAKPRPRVAAVYTI